MLRREQITLQVALITPLIHVRGWAAPETKAAADRARLLIEQAEAVGEPPEDLLLLFSALYGVWATILIAFNGDALRNLAAQVVALAEKQGSAVPLMIGYRLMGMSLLHTGDIAEGRMYFDRAIAFYDPAAHRRLATRFGQDLRVSILCYRSFALWMLGYPEAALDDIEHALQDAREIGHAATLMYTVANAQLAHFLCRNYERAKTLIDELIALSDEKGSLYWKSIGMMNRGTLFALTGNASDAVRMITSGIAAFRLTGSTWGMPSWLTDLASTYAKLTQFDKARHSIDEAITAIEGTKETWRAVYTHCAAGQIELELQEPNVAKAEEYFQRALSVARQQQAKSWELRASMNLARLWRDQGKPQQARELLAPVYGWFTEGFDTRDLKEAKALLEELAA